MTATKRPRTTKRSRSPAPLAVGPPAEQRKLEWQFDGEIIRHEDDNDDEACHICDRWSYHYCSENGKARSLEKAESARHDWFRRRALTSLKPPVVRQELADKSQEILKIREELSSENFNADRLREELENATKALEDKQRENAALLEESLQPERTRIEEAWECDHLRQEITKVMETFVDVHERLKELRNEKDDYRRELENVRRELEGTRS